MQPSPKWNEQGRFQQNKFFQHQETLINPAQPQLSQIDARSMIEQFKTDVEKHTTVMNEIKKKFGIKDNNADANNFHFREDDYLPGYKSNRQSAHTLPPKVRDSSQVTNIPNMPNLNQNQLALTSQVDHIFNSRHYKAMQPTMKTIKSQVKNPKVFQEMLIKQKEEQQRIRLSEKLKSPHSPAQRAQERIHFTPEHSPNASNQTRDIKESIVADEKKSDNIFMKHNQEQNTIEINVSEISKPKNMASELEKARQEATPVSCSSPVSRNMMQETVKKQMTAKHRQQRTTATSPLGEDPNQQQGELRKEISSMTDPSIEKIHKKHQLDKRTQEASPNDFSPNSYSNKKNKRPPNYRQVPSSIKENRQLYQQ